MRCLQEATKAFNEVASRQKGGKPRVNLRLHGVREFDLRTKFELRLGVATVQYGGRRYTIWVNTSLELL